MVLLLCIDARNSSHLILSILNTILGRHYIGGYAAVALPSAVGANSSTIVKDATPCTAPDHSDTSATLSASQRGTSIGLPLLTLTMPPREDANGSSLAPFHPSLLPPACTIGDDITVITEVGSASSGQVIQGNQVSAKDIPTRGSNLRCRFPATTHASTTFRTHSQVQPCLPQACSVDPPRHQSLHPQ